MRLDPLAALRQAGEPNPIDRMVSFFNPRAGVKRMMARAALNFATGGYDGARGDNKLLRGMRTTDRGADGETIGDLPALRARSHELYRNSGFAGGAVKTTVTSVVGWGLDVQPRIDHRYLGMTTDEAREWQRHAKRFWWQYAWSKACDWTGRCNFPGNTDLALRSRLLSGDVFVSREWRPLRPGELFGTRIQLIEAARVCNPHNQSNTDTLVEGIELSPEGEPVACWVLDRFPDPMGLTAGTWTRLPFRGAKSGEARVIHLYRPDRPNATRGVPYLSGAIKPLRGLGMYSDNELMASIVSALFTVFVEHSDLDEDDTSPIGIQEAAGLPASGQSPERAAAELRMGNAAIVDLVPGAKASFANPTRPNGAFEPFVSAILQEVGVQLELPYELVVKRFNSSYSASMASLQEAWRFIKTERDWLINNFSQQIYEWMLAEAVLRGYLEAPGFFEDPLARQAWCGATWSGPSRGHIQPAQEASAAGQRMESGLTAMDEEISAYSGRDWEDVIEQRALERRMLIDAGLTVEAVAQRVISESTSTTVAPTDDPEKLDKPGEDD
ncbi:MAG: phage portal protein [Gemmatimonadales bacterium]|nr:phage portal protein [Gemmatimonadales bacterium]